MRHSSGKVITKWVDPDQGHGGHRSRLVGRELIRDNPLELCAPTLNVFEMAGCTLQAITFTPHANDRSSSRSQMETGRRIMSIGSGLEAEPPWTNWERLAMQFGASEQRHQADRSWRQPPRSRRCRAASMAGCQAETFWRPQQTYETGITNTQP